MCFSPEVSFASAAVLIPTGSSCHDAWLIAVGVGAALIALIYLLLI